MVYKLYQLEKIYYGVFWYFFFILGPQGNVSWTLPNPYIIYKGFFCVNTTLLRVHIMDFINITFSEPHVHFRRNIYVFRTTAVTQKKSSKRNLKNLKKSKKVRKKILRGIFLAVFISWQGKNRSFYGDLSFRAYFFPRKPIINFFLIQTRNFN